MVPWVAEYIWLGGNNELRSKKRVLIVLLLNLLIDIMLIISI